MYSARPHVPIPCVEGSFGRVAAQRILMISYILKLTLHKYPRFFRLNTFFLKVFLIPNLNE